MKKLICFPPPPPRFRISIISTTIFMLINHLYLFSNLTLNNDSVNFAMTGETFEHCISFGRWFQWIMDAFSSHGVPPTVNGFLSILYISISICLLLEIFRIEKPLFIICMSAVFTSFPVLACDFLYWYNADTTWLSLLLSIISIYLLQKNYKRNFFYSILLLTLSCGIYQVFWSFAAGLLFVILLWDFLLDQNVMASFKRGCIYLASLICSIICYAGVTKLLQFITGIPSSTYKGLDKAGQFGSIRELYWALRDAYTSFFSFFLTDRTFTSHLVIILNSICFILIISGVGKLIFSNKNSMIFKVAATILFIASPLAVNNLSVISRNQMHEVNMIAMIIPYCLLIAMLSFFESSINFPSKYSLTAGIACLFLLSYINYLTTNKIYMRTQLNYETTYAYLNRLVSRIEEYPGYTSSTPVCLLNENNYNGNHIEIFTDKNSIPSHKIDPVFSSVDDKVSVLNKYTFVTNTLDIQDFFAFYFGMNINIIIDGDEMDAIWSLPEVQNMRLYPDSNGIQMIDDILVIKLPG